MRFEMRVAEWNEKLLSLTSHIPHPTSMFFTNKLQMSSQDGNVPQASALFLTLLESGSGGNFFGPLSPFWPWIEVSRGMKDQC